MIIAASRARPKNTITFNRVNSIPERDYTAQKQKAFPPPESRRDRRRGRTVSGGSFTTITK
jgi:hypothetical protein